MKLSEEKREALIAWLEGMPWWSELPYAQLEDELKRCRKLAHSYIEAYEKLAFVDALKEGD